MKSNEEKIALLNDTVEYYSEDIQRRCVDVATSICYYSPTSLNNNEKSCGCAIGRLLEPELRLELDNKARSMNNSAVKNMFEFLPEDIQSYGLLFLARLQDFHDNDENWDIGSLSERGQMIVDDIKREVNEYFI